MRILLPPSEAKRAGGRGPALETVQATTEIEFARRTVANALVNFCSGSPETAALALALPARSAARDLAANRLVLTSPTVPALDRYSGIVYDGLDARTLTPAGRRRALASIVIFSGLFGVLNAGEPVPAYRLPVMTDLPPLGGLTAFWRELLRRELPERLGSELILDLRSSDYAAMWRPDASLRDQIVTVRIMSELPGGRLAVVSYPSKLGKGRLARALITSRKQIVRAAQIADAWVAIGGRDATLRAPGNSLDLLI